MKDEEGGREIERKGRKKTKQKETREVDDERDLRFSREEEEN